ncbi:MAG: G/U mismatch-specific DNA glycosylase [Actinomycetota bacterium]|nr:G/U mismatch-specific DNA glycosylase [Actinomycetota bacterium]
MTGVADIIGPHLRVLFCGINPGLMSGQLGQHFARPGNRFWKLLAASGLTDRLLVPAEQDQLLSYGLGITNIVEATTASAAELPAADLRAGAPRLEAKAVALAPACVAVLGMQAYRVAFRRPGATLGRQVEPLGESMLWLLPNPSGLQARYQMAEMTELWAELAADTPTSAR